MTTLDLSLAIEHWPYIAPFRIAGFDFTGADVLVATIRRNGQSGRGEAYGVFYRGETATSMRAAIEKIGMSLKADLTREALRDLMPPGGARNAIDCALWDLEAKLSGAPAWRTADLQDLRPLLTTLTIGAETPAVMARCAQAHTHARALKLKLLGDADDGDRVRAVRAARSDVWLGVDGNQGFDRNALLALLPTLIEMKVSLIEQPLRADEDQELDGFVCPIPLAADESLQDLTDLDRLHPAYSVANIKLDKCGGLTEALDLARAVRSKGLTPMVGGMLGTSLAMAPAFIVGQFCDIVDLDCPTFLQTDRAHGATYEGGMIRCDEALWGGAV